jgi:antitoxin component of MazEF toxin-antitoxin module
VREKIIRVDDVPALVLTPDLLAQLGLRIGDEVEVVLTDGALTVRPVAEVARDAKVAAAADDVFARRRDALKRLAQ